MGGQPGEPLGAAGRREHAEPQAVAGQRARAAVTAPGLACRARQLLGDVRDDPGVRRRRGREHRGAVGQRGEQVADAAVVGAEVVAPVADAVRLVDDDAGRQRAASPGSCSARNRGLFEPLGADQQDVDLVVGERLGDVVPLVGVGGVHRHGADARPAAAAATWSRISASSGDTISVGPRPRARSSAVATK